MTEGGILLVAGIIGVLMYIQLIVNTGDTARILRRIEKRLEERDLSQPPS